MIDSYKPVLCHSETADDVVLVRAISGEELIRLPSGHLPAVGRELLKRGVVSAPPLRIGYGYLHVQLVRSKPGEAVAVFVPSKVRCGTCAAVMECCCDAAECGCADLPEDVHRLLDPRCGDCVAALRDAAAASEDEQFEHLQLRCDWCDRQYCTSCAGSKG